MKAWKSENYAIVFGAVVWSFLLLAGCATSVSNSLPIERMDYPDDDTIVPHTRAGRVYIGMSVRDLFAELGKPNRTLPNGGISADYIFEQRGISVTADERVTSMVIWGNRYHTREGVRPGSPRADVIVGLGKPFCAGSADGTWFNYSGFHISFNRKEDVDRIMVYRGTRICA